MLIEKFIITVYCLVDEALKNLVVVEKLGERGFHPSLSNSEVVKMEVVTDASCLL